MALGNVLHEHIKINENSQVAYVNNADKRLCTLSHLTKDQVEEIRSSNNRIQIHTYPSFMKIHQSVFNYFTLYKESPVQWSPEHRRNIKISNPKIYNGADFDAEGSMISIEVSPLVVKSARQLRYRIKKT